MYGNNFGYPFIGGTPPMMGNMMTPMMQAPLRSTNSGGLRSLLGLGRTTNTISGATKGINFTSILNGASKTLGVVKDAIPVVKEVGPMMNNMRSMLKIASVFKDETDTKKEDNSSNINNTVVNNNSTTSNSNLSNQSKNSPNFFL